MEGFFRDAPVKVKIKLLGSMFPEKIEFDGKNYRTKAYNKVLGLSSYLVWVGVKFSNAKEEKLLINDASQIGSKKFDFSIE